MRYYFVIFERCLQVFRVAKCHFSGKKKLFSLHLRSVLKYLQILLEKKAHVAIAKDLMKSSCLSSAIDFTISHFWLSLT